MKDNKFIYHQKKIANNIFFKIVLKPHKNGISKIINLLDTTSDNVLTLFTKN